MPSPSYDEVLYALIQTADVLEVLRRGHGTDVSAKCYPALNLARQVIARHRVDDDGNLMSDPVPTPDKCVWCDGEGGDIGGECDHCHGKGHM